MWESYEKQLSFEYESSLRVALGSVCTDAKSYDPNNNVKCEI